MSRKDLKGGGASRSDPEAERRQRAEEALPESERRLALVRRSVGRPICTHDSDGRVLSANPAMVRLTGYSEREFIGRLLSDFLSESTRHEFRDYLETILTRDGHAEGFMRIVTKDGKERVLLYENVLQTDGLGGRRRLRRRARRPAKMGRERSTSVGSAGSKRC